MIVFVKEILIYSWRNKEHEEHLRIALKTLKEKKLYAEFKKYEL